MARPVQIGINYFSFNTDFFADDKVKLIRSEFGAQGLLILIYLYCEIYRGEGYYKVWNDDVCMLVADGVACGCTPKLVQQVVRRCVERGLFDGMLFRTHGILTSAGIQRRYLRACSNRDEIELRSAYWLLDAGSRRDVLPAILKKLVLLGEEPEETRVSSKKTPISLELIPQRKEKEKKEKKKGSGETPTPDEVKAYCKGKKLDPERFWNYYAARGWVLNGAPVCNWKALADNWERSERPKDEPAHRPSYDLEAFEKYDIFDREAQPQRAEGMEEGQ